MQNHEKQLKVINNTVKPVPHITLKNTKDDDAYYLSSIDHSSDINAIP